MNPKVTLVAVALTFGTFVHASFEMILVTDSTYNVIRRFDGVTGAALGTFGGNYGIAPRAITINQSLQRAYVFDRQSRNIYAFNYNTGEYIQNWDTQGQYYTWLSTDNSGNIIMCGSSASGDTVMKRYSPTGSLLTTWNIAAGTDLFGAAQAADGSVWATDGYGGGSDTTLKFSTSGGSFTNGYSFPEHTYGGDTRANGNTIFVPSATTNYTFFTTSAPATTTTINLSTYLDTAIGVGFGHADNAYFCGAKTSNGTIVRYNTRSKLTNSLISVTGTSFASMTVVVAPEPSGYLFIAGGFGLLTLIKRRRK